MQNYKISSTQNTNRSPLKGKYLVQKTLYNKLLKCVDLFLSLVITQDRHIIPLEPRSILISNLAHMGDVLLLTSLISVLRQKFPNAKIGVLVGSWSHPIVQKHPFIDRVHTVDHWKISRAPCSKYKKILKYYKTKKEAVKEIKNEHYEVAIDGYYYFPNAIPILNQTKIPIRIGYTSGGFGPLLTHALDWKNLNQPLAHYYLPLLEFLNIPQNFALSFLSPSLNRPSHGAGTRYLKQKLTCELESGYIVIHVGTGSHLKEWPLENWRALARKLNDFPLIFTGRGEEEKRKVEAIISGIENCYNFVDIPKWEEFLSILQDAHLLIGLDSLGGHIAAALDIPAVLIYSGMSNIYHWAPMSKKTQILTKKVSCAPCYRSQGCSAMTCVREVGIEEVYDACNSLISEIQSLR